MQKLPVPITTPSPSPSPSEFESGFESNSDSDSDSETGIGCISELDTFLSREYTIPEQTFITEVYHICHSKHLDAVRRDDAGQNLLAFASNLHPGDRCILEIPGSPLAANVELPIGMGEKRSESEPLSATDLVSVHRAAGAVAQYGGMLPIPHHCESASQVTELGHSSTHASPGDSQATIPVLLNAGHLSHAIDTLLAFAASREHRDVARLDMPWTVVWAAEPSGSPGNFLATTNAHELAAMVDKGSHDELMSPQ